MLTLRLVVDHGRWRLCNTIARRNGNRDRAIFRALEVRRPVAERGEELQPLPEILPLPGVEARLPGRSAPVLTHRRLLERGHGALHHGDQLRQFVLRKLQWLSRRLHRFCTVREFGQRLLLALDRRLVLTDAFDAPARESSFRHSGKIDAKTAPPQGGRFSPLSDGSGVGAVHGPCMVPLSEVLEVFNGAETDCAMQGPWTAPT